MVEMDLDAFSECVANIDTTLISDDGIEEPRRSNEQMSHLPSIQGPETPSRSDRFIIDSQVTMQTKSTLPN